MNPFIRLWETPVETLAIGAYLLVLLAALVATWYVLGRNLLTLYIQYEKDSWKTPPAAWAARAIAVPIILSIDLLLVAAFVHFLT